MRWFILLLPWLELYSLILLGGNIGAFSTLLYVFLSFVLGLTILRLQGQGIIRKLQASAGTQIVSAPMISGELAMGLGGLLLMIPGLITDFIALPIMLGSFLRRGEGAGGSAPNPSARQQYGSRMGPDDSIEGEFRRLDDD